MPPWRAQTSVACGPRGSYADPPIGEDGLDHIRVEVPVNRVRGGKGIPIGCKPGLTGVVPYALILTAVLLQQAVNVCFSAAGQKSGG